MKSGGYYDVHSEYQRRVVEGGDTLIRGVVSRLDPGSLEGTFTIADYGAGTGATSVHAVGTTIDALREHSPKLPVAAIHNDVATNDFWQLFRDVTGADGYLDRAGGPVYPMAAAGSFFSQVVPDASVDLGRCSNASHWYREQPEVAVPDGMYFSDATGSARRTLAEQAAGDWLDFLTARAAELAPAGRLLVEGIGTERGPDAKQRVSAARLLRVMWDVAMGLADEGKLDRGALDGYVLAVYCRSAEEATAPIRESGPLADAFEVDTAEVEEVANPYWEMLERDGDREAYAEAYTAFVRAFAESTMVEHLFEPAARGIEPKQLCDEFFTRLRAASAADPEAGRYEAWILRLVLTRR
jgi:cyclopropane-fatty-acyl-phospholipid synthase